MSLEPQAISEAQNAAPLTAVDSMSVVDRIAIRMLCTKVCGATSRSSNVAEARELWRTTPESNREAWRREARALLADIAGADNGVLPHDWRAVHIPPGTPFWDEPSEMQPPGWFLFGGFSSDPEEGAAFVLQVDQALDRDDTGMSLERLAKAVAARLNGGQA